MSTSLVSLDGHSRCGKPYIHDALALFGDLWIDNHDSLLNVAQNQIHMAIISLRTPRSSARNLGQEERTHMQNSSNLSIPAQLNKYTLAE
jgi:hypothetical protein